MSKRKRPTPLPGQRTLDQALQQPVGQPVPHVRPPAPQPVRPLAPADTDEEDDGGNPMIPVERPRRGLSHRPNYR